MRTVRLVRKALTRWLTGITICFAVCSGVVAWPARAFAEDVMRAAPYPVGMTQLEYLDPSDGGRPLNLRYRDSDPATTASASAARSR